MGYFSDASISEIVSILAGIVTVISGAVALIVFLVKKIKNKKLLSDVISTASSDQAIYLNKPKSLGDECKERDELLEEVLNIIKRKNYRKNYIAIVGSEGIGKTLFCQELFFNHLVDSKLYLGWIECNGSQSIYDVDIKPFLHPLIAGKNKEDILTKIENLGRPCVLFVDQVDQYTSLDEIEELKKCPNITVVVSGLLKSVYFIDEDNHFHLKRLSDKTTKKIFKQKLGDRIYEDIRSKDKRDIDVVIIPSFVKGNPFLAGAFARAGVQNNNSWGDILKIMVEKETTYGEESDDNYVKKILKQLYKIDKLMDDEKNAVSKLCVFSSLKNTKEVFIWSNISMDCVVRLCKTYWLTQEDNIMYCMDEIHKDVLKKVLAYSENLRELIMSLASYIGNWNTYEDKGFKWISSYVEDILKKVKGYAPHLMEDSDLFAQFAYVIADKYHFADKDNKKSLEWLGYCNPIGVTLPDEIVFSAYKKFKKVKNHLLFRMIFLICHLIYRKYHQRIPMLKNIF